MRYAIFSDLHDNRAALQAVIDDATAHVANRLLYLGDVGSDPRLFAALRERSIPCTFGNWEVIGLRRMARDQAEWVGGWPATLRAGGALCAHATPDLPATVTDTRGAHAFMMNVGGVNGLFPRLHLDEDALWQAFARLEVEGVQLFFHGHTHVQMAFRWNSVGGKGEPLRQITAPGVLRLEPSPAVRYVIGVGSAGQPMDGRQGRYVLYDDTAQVVILRRLGDPVIAS